MPVWCDDNATQTPQKQEQYTNAIPCNTNTGGKQFDAMPKAAPLRCARSAPIQCDAMQYTITKHSNPIERKHELHALDPSTIARRKSFFDPSNPVSAQPASQLLRRFGHPALEVRDGMPEAAPSPPAPQQQILWTDSNHQND